MPHYAVRKDCTTVMVVQPTWNGAATAPD